MNSINNDVVRSRRNQLTIIGAAVLAACLFSWFLLSTLPNRVCAREEKIAENKLESWIAFTFHELARPSEDALASTRNEIGDAFFILPKERQAEPYWQLFSKYLAEGEYKKAHQMGLEALRLSETKPDNFSIYVASLAGDTTWLRAIPQKHEASGFAAHSVFVQAAILWSDRDAAGVVRITESIDALARQGDDIYGADAAWLAFLRGVALYNQRDYDGAADAVGGLTPTCVLTMHSDFVGRVHVVGKLAEIYVYAGRFQDAMTFLMPLRRFLDKLDPSWNAQRKEVEALIDHVQKAVNSGQPD